MLQTLPIHVSDLLKRLTCNMWSGVVLEEDHWNSAVSKFLSDTLQLLAIEVGIDGLTLFKQFPVDNAAPIPPYAQHRLLCPKVTFRSLSWLLTGRSPLSM